MIMDFINYVVVDDKIFIEESPKGFIIEVYNIEGHHLYNIEKKNQPLKVLES